jgi:PAS domain S-box-containing protein
MPELQVSQVKLEPQKCELSESRNDLGNTEKRYKELYNKYANLFDLAPNAYVVLNQAGTICEANLTAALLLNEPKSKLIGQPITGFIHHDDQQTFHLLKQDCLKSGDPHIAELTMVQTSDKRFPAQIQLQSLPCSDQAGNEFRAAIMDLSEQARISANLHLLHQCLEIAVRANDTRQLLEAYVRQIKKSAQCSAVGIRLRDETGRIPYQAYDGFSRQFYESESPLSLHNDQCLCIDVVKGRFNPAKPYFTAFGSFFINGTSRFLATVPPEELGRTRNVCHAQGYESVALIPITIDHAISGLIHVADCRENMFPLSVVEVLEQAAMRLGLALQRLHMQSCLAESVANLHELSSHLLKAKEEEQRRMAMELHDQTGQDLNVLKLRLRQLRDRLRKDQPLVKQSCTEMLAFTDQIIDTVRRMTRGLNPSALEALGLRAAVKQMVREFRDYAGVSVETDIDPLERVTGRETQISLYRIIQEALTNINKHAQATRAVILSIEDDDAGAILVVVEDNGKGFDCRKVHTEEDRENGMGLAAMQLRSRMIGARLTIWSQPGQGCRITVNLPVQKCTGAS